MDPSPTTVTDRSPSASGRSLRAFFAPRSVALIGATDKAGSVGRTILTNLIGSPFGGTVYPVNPTRPSVLGIAAHPSVSDIPEQVELAVIVTPPRDDPRPRRRVRPRRVRERHRHLGGLQGGRPRGSRARASARRRRHAPTTSGSSDRTASGS